MKRLVGISACLLGINCRYDGGNKKIRNLDAFLEKYIPVPICPEQLGGLPTPRPPASFTNGDGKKVLEGRSRIVNIGGRDVTENILKGAEEALKILKMLGVELLFLKDKSPACGVEKIYIGENCVEGIGVLKALIESKGVKITVIKGDEL